MALEFKPEQIRILREAFTAWCNEHPVEKLEKNVRKVADSLAAELDIMETAIDTDPGLAEDCMRYARFIARSLGITCFA